MYGAGIKAVIAQLYNRRVENISLTKAVAGPEQPVTARVYSSRDGFFMKIQDMIDTILKGSSPLGTFLLPELIGFAEKGSINGIAAAKENEKLQYLAILAGEPEGAIFIDEKGTLYGDKAVMLFTDNESFILYDVNPDLVDAVVAGCRIFEKSHMKKRDSYELPEFGKKNAGLGVFTLTIRRDNEPQNGVRVSLRKDGKVVGSDVTTRDGSVGFKLVHGKYDVIVQDRNQQLTTFHVQFEDSSPQKVLQL